MDATDTRHDIKVEHLQPFTPIALPSSLDSITDPSQSFSENLAQESDCLWYKRPDVDKETLLALQDLSPFYANPHTISMLVDYSKGISFALGEGGRELLRACLNSRGCKGRQLQGASVPALLQLANHWKLWPVALRIKIERATGEFCPTHEAFVRFKAMQSQLRKFLKRDQMQADRDTLGNIQTIHFDEVRYLSLGKAGRERLRGRLRRMHEETGKVMDELLERHGFRYSELRNATVPQLLKMAYICGFWDDVVDACRDQERRKTDHRNVNPLDMPMPIESSSDRSIKSEDANCSTSTTSSIPDTRPIDVKPIGTFPSLPDIFAENHRLTQATSPFFSLLTSDAQNPFAPTSPTTSNSTSDSNFLKKRQMSFNTSASLKRSKGPEDLINNNNNNNVDPYAGKFGTSVTQAVPENFMTDSAAAAAFVRALFEHTWPSSDNPIFDASNSEATLAAAEAAAATFALSANSMNLANLMQDVEGAEFQSTPDFPSSDLLAAFGSLLPDQARDPDFNVSRFLANVSLDNLSIGGWNFPSK